MFSIIIMIKRRLKKIQLGVNWYLNSNTRVTVNYAHANVDRLDDESADTVAIRFNIDF